MESKTKHILATAKWCAPCKILKARLQESNLKVDEIVDVDKHLDFSRNGDTSSSNIDCGNRKLNPTDNAKYF